MDDPLNKKEKCEIFELLINVNSNFGRTKQAKGLYVARWPPV
jgi:hypothetical protein